MRLKFWGVRGSTPTPQIENLAYGGNTPCIEVRSPEGHIVILDGGTGLRQLGQSLMKELKAAEIDVHLMLTHFHWDHIQGIPFFVPLYLGDDRVTFYAPAALGGLREHLEGQMSRPYFPVTIETGRQREFVEIDSNEFRVGDLRIRPFPLNHPGGAFGYRIESKEHTIVYASDLEHGHATLDRTVREYASNADVLIYDAQYTPEEYEKHRGWGHSTWLEATAVARDAGVQQLILFHHDPWHTDSILLDVLRKARSKFENTLAAMEGWTAEL